MNVLGGNVDDHTKNFAFMLPKNGDWQITPAYDVTFTVDVNAMHYANYHNLSVRGKVTNITEKDLLAFAKDNSIKNAVVIIDEVANVLATCWTYLTNAGVSRYWADRIEAYVAELLPDRYRKEMKHYLPTILDQYVCENGTVLNDISIRETRNGELMLTAIVEGKEKRHLFDKKSKELQEIRQIGWIHLSKEDLVKYAMVLVSVDN